ncbi:nodulation S family protein (plasmid) [Roseivivax marinus]|jgi:SAM-dependent methyltransferase|uniref:SAM-dependent methyltransferase n=1 Tax=Roseivivax marinus TaxID=1379903 RepID=UPI001F049F5D|nr:SAM-dependent methyltransferase [Roseivivax marinus]UMA67147.1 nodulation S family protein [Roseivivax marinus]
MPRPETLRHLEGLYSGTDDPWSHETSDYERAKHGETLRLCGSGPHRNALEIGCGNGVLAAALAPRCTRLTVVECIPAAAAAARRRLAGFDHVAVVEGDARTLPVSAPDLVVLSEMLYFLTPGEIATLAQAISDGASPACRIVSVNWLGATDEALGGQQAADLLLRHLPDWTCQRHVRQGYLADVFDAPTTAADT